jgi:hypothetical protein
VQALSEYPEAVRFAETATAFCRAIGNAAASKRRVLFKDCFVLVSELIAQATLLPDVDGDLDTARESYQFYADIVRNLKQRTGDRDYCPRSKREALRTR